MYTYTVRVPANTKFVGSYLDPSEDVSARVTTANKAYYKIKTTMSQESGVAKKLKLRLCDGTVKPTLLADARLVDDFAKKSAEGQD